MTSESKRESDDAPPNWQDVIEAMPDYALHERLDDEDWVDWQPDELAGGWGFPLGGNRS